MHAQTVGATHDAERGKAQLKVAAGVVGGLLAGGLILIALLTILILILVCIRKARSGSFKIGEPTNIC